MFQKVWGFAEQMDWDGRFPRPLWRWLLRWCDRRAGHHLTYDNDTGCDGGG